MSRNLNFAIICLGVVLVILGIGFNDQQLIQLNVESHHGFCSESRILPTINYTLWFLGVIIVIFGIATGVGLKHET